MRIGVDLGGTNVRVGLVDDSNIMNMLSEKCKADKSEQVVVNQIIDMIDKLISPEVECIGVGVPSVVDAQNGVVYNVVSIPSWREVHLKEVLESRFNVPVSINNDCNCFAIGVCRFGECKSYSNVVCVALGTGVGAGIVINGKLYCGNNTGAGEIGSIPYLDSDYEYYCSSRFFVGCGTTGKQAHERALAGDEQALALWREFGVHLGELVKVILYAYDPEAIVFGGSVAEAFDLFSESMYKQIDSFPYEKTVESLRIYHTSVENISLLGASCCK